MFFLYPVTELGDGGTDLHEILHDGTYRSRTNLLPFWGRYLGVPPNPKFWAYILAI